MSSFFVAAPSRLDRRTSGIRFSARGDGGHLAHRIDPVPGVFLVVRVPSENPVPAKNDLAVLLLDVVLDDEESFEVEPPRVATGRFAPRSPRRRGELLFAFPLAHESLQLE